MKIQGKQTTKQRIFQAAVELFAAKGYSGSSMRDLAKRVGVKESSLYNHYGGKQAILDAILQYHRESFESSTLALDELKRVMPPTDDPVEFWMAGVQAFMAKTPPLTELITRIIYNEMFLNAQCRDFVLQGMFSAQKKLTETIFRAMFEMGLIKEDNFSLLADQYVHMVFGLDIEYKLRSLEGQSPEQGLAYLVEHMTFFIKRMV